MNYDKEIMPFLVFQKNGIDYFQFNNRFRVLVNHSIDIFNNAENTRPVMEISTYLKADNDKYELYEYFFDPMSENEINTYLKEVYTNRK